MIFCFKKCLTFTTTCFTETAGAPQELGDTDSYRDDTVPGFSLEPATDEEDEEPKTKVHVVYGKNC